jgi:hypothetical protein
MKLYPGKKSERSLAAKNPEVKKIVDGSILLMAIIILRILFVD